MIKQIEFTLLFVVFAVPLWAQAPGEPAELGSLRESWQRATKEVTAPLDRKYQDALSALKLRYTKEGKPTEALAVEEELKKFAKETDLQKPQRATPAGLLGTWTWKSADKSDASSIQFEKDGIGSHGGRLNTTWKVDDNKDIIITHPTKGRAVIHLKPDSKSFSGTGYDGKPVTGTRMK